ncbi:MAG: pyridoxal phosphate-dependent decarboxylase family protein [Anaeromyxobacteraceae bacterium]
MPASPTAALLADAARRAAAYLDGLGGRSVTPSADAVAALAALDVPFPEAGVPASAVVEELDRRISPATMAVAGPRFFGFVIGGSLPATVAANLLATAWDQNSAKWLVAPGTAAVEKVALRWTLEALGLPPSVAGGFVTGATVANFTALAAARHAVLARAGWDVEARGLFGAPPITLVVGGEVHVSVQKALAMLGLGRERVVTVPVDGQGRMRADALPALRGPAIVCVQAGNVNTGAFDPAPAIVARAREAGAWVHVDGAFGLWAAASPRRAHLTAGVADADSWATDAHKWLNVPYDSGLALVRDEAALAAAMGITAAYLPAAGLRDPADATPELSRRARGVEVWAALRHLGRAGLAELVERTCRHAARFAEGLTAAGHRVLNEVVLNQVLVSFGDDARTREVIAAIQADGTCWCGGTVWQGQTAMRISVSSWATTDEDVERSLAAMVRAARRG